MVSIVLMVAGLVLFILSAVAVPVPRVNLQSAGLACWIAAQLFGPMIR